MGMLEAILAKLRERELDRYAAAYAVSAWILVQAASIALPAFERPPWVMRWLIAAVLLGFPAMLITVWILKEPSKHSAHRRRNALALVALGVVAVLTLGELGWHFSSGAAPSPAAAAAPANASIAVLPFENTSSDAGQKFFSEGVAEELIGILARNPVLRVAARTSSFAFEGKNMDARDIAQRLNVRTVLEGSIRTADGRARVEVDLINAADGYQIWAQTYERPLKDILAVQSEIAQSIAGSLTPQLTGESLRKSIPKPISIDPDIYRTYLEAQFALNKRGAAIHESVEKFRRVVKAVPNFADAQAGLAYALTIQSNVDQRPYPEADTVLATALKLDPTNPLALTVAIDRALARSDWNGVIDYANRLRATGSRSGVALHGLANAYSALGFFDQSIAVSREVESLDPMTDIAGSDVAFGKFLRGDYTAAITAADVMIARQPDDLFYRNLKCNSATYLKKFEISEAMIAIMKSQPADTASVEECELFEAVNSGQTERAKTLANDTADRATQWGEEDSEVAWLLAATGQFDRAMDWFEHADDKKDLNRSMLFSAQIPKALRNTTRWKQLLDRPGFQAWRAGRERAKREWGFSQSEL